MRWINVSSSANTFHWVMNIGTLWQTKTDLIRPLLWREINISSISWTFQLHWTSDPCSRFFIKSTIILIKKNNPVRWYSHSVALKIECQGIKHLNFESSWNAHKNLFQGGLTWRPTVKLRRSNVFFPGASAMGKSTVTLALLLLPYPLPANAPIVII